MVKEHQHPFWIIARDDGGDGYITTGANTYNDGGHFKTSNNIDGGPENRPINMAVRYFIRARP